MRVKLTVIATFAILALALVAGSRQTVVYSGDWATLPQGVSEKPAVGLDIGGKRGPVLFHHRGHESFERRAGFDAPYLNKDAGSMNCVVCHHRRDTTDPTRPDSIDVADRKQFQKCTECHRVAEDDPRNFVDRE